MGGTFDSDIPGTFESATGGTFNPLLSVDVKKIGVDASYAGNANRELCTSNGIQTSFVQKGKRAKEKREKDFVRQELARVRATAMEGSFGTQKEHYSLPLIKARKKEAEMSCTSSSAFTRRMWCSWRRPHSLMPQTVPSGVLEKRTPGWR